MNLLKKLAGVPKLQQELQETKALALSLLSRQSINSATVQYASWDQFSGKDRFLTNVDVYAVVKKLYETCARLPMYTYEVKPDTEKKSLNRLRSLLKGHYIDSAAAFAIKSLQYKALEEVPENDAADQLLDKPNPYQTRTEFLENIFYYRIKGEWFVFKMRLPRGKEGGANAGTVKELYVLNPAWVGVKSTNSFPTEITGYVYQIPGTGITIPIEPEDIIHGKNFNPEDVLRGLDPLRPGSRNIQRGEAAEDVSVQQLKNGGVPAIVYNEEVTANEISQPELDAMREAYDSFATNPYNKGKLFFAAGKVGVAQTGSTLTDLAVLDGEAASFRKFCRNMGVSPLLFGDTLGFTYENYKEAKKELYTSTCLPIAYSVADKITNNLYTEFTDKRRLLAVDLSGISELQEDMQKTATALAAMPFTLTPNEARELWNYDRIEGDYVDEIFVKDGYTPMSGLALPEPVIVGA